MGKRHITPLQTGRIRLRLLEEQDLPQTLAWRNQDHVRCWFFFSERLTLEQHAAWFARYRQRDDDFVFIIEEAERGGHGVASGHKDCTVGVGQYAVRPGVAAAGSFPQSEASGGEFRPIGQTSLYNIDWTSGTVDCGRLMIGEADATGRGFAREATNAVIALAFEQLNLQEVRAEVIPSNVRSIKVFEACGFEVSGSTERALRMSKRAVVRTAPAGVEVFSADRNRPPQAKAEEERSATMISDALCKKIAEALNVALDRIEPTAAAADIPEWDSMGSMCLLLMLNRDFGVTPRAEEMGELQSVQGIAALVNNGASRT
ncbi:MAG: GNAT family N-acetyltransferase [Thermoguttaceae bacterium]